MRQKLENENVTPLWIKWICCIWQSLEEKIVLMSELMSRSREIKVVHNFQLAAPVIHAEDNRSHVRANSFN